MPTVVGLCFLTDFAAFSVSVSCTLSCAGRMNVNRMAGLRRGDQLFISCAGPYRTNEILKQHLFLWVVQAITSAYSTQGLQLP